MSKSRQPLPYPNGDFSSDEEFYRAYTEYKNSFDTSPVEDFSDLNIEFTANGQPINTPSMSNFSEDITESIKKHIMENSPSSVTEQDIHIMLNEGNQRAGATYHFGDGDIENIYISWTTHQEDYERVLPDGNPVEMFSTDFYSMEMLNNLERLAKEQVQANENEFAAGIQSIPDTKDQSKEDGLNQ